MLEFDYNSVLIRLNSLNAIRSFWFVPLYYKGYNIQYRLYTKEQIWYVNRENKVQKVILHLKDILQIFIS